MLVERLEDKYKFTADCPICGKEHSVELSLEDGDRLMKERPYKLIQEILPPDKFSPELREFFISNMCEECQKEIFR